MPSPTAPAASGWDPIYRCRDTPKFLRSAIPQGWRTRRAASVPAGSKLCKRCNIVKPAADFAKDRSSKDGLYSICKADEKLDRDRKKAAAPAA